ncbi:hypothetical protein N7472_008887 [Penicillium cf. griseofulvum]|uniref:Uncharacterized protein n=1 Tax=Penicillium cf. griseofulvum TaxID=2972120 RepID=A0A9W9J4I1_9EURO|nr:hypothetical protein N7472_008887 [Penicillium cf. griseofulvum]
MGRRGANILKGFTEGAGSMRSAVESPHAEKHEFDFAWDLKRQLVQGIKATLKKLNHLSSYFPYAGHRAINNLDGTSFANRICKKLVSWKDLQTDSTPSGLPMNTFAILDCCHTGRASNSSPHSTHVLSAYAVPPPPHGRDRACPVYPSHDELQEQDLFSILAKCQSSIDTKRPHVSCFII